MQNNRRKSEILSDEQLQQKLVDRANRENTPSKDMQLRKGDDTTRIRELLRKRGVFLFGDDSPVKQDQNKQILDFASFGTEFSKFYKAMMEIDREHHEKGTDYCEDPRYSCNSSCATSLFLNALKQCLTLDEVDRLALTMADVYHQFSVPRSKQKDTHACERRKEEIRSKK